MTGNKRIVIQDRDRHLLGELGVVRFVDREQAKCVAGFGSTTRANVRLLALTRAGLLRRFSLGATDSGRKYLYSLSKRAAQLVGVPYRGLRRPSGEMVVADFVITHQMKITEIFCRVKYGAMPTTDLRFVRWTAFHSAIDSHQALIPDGYFEVAVRETILASFLEVDLGHEGRKIWTGKVQAYLHYAVSGEFERHHAQPRFRVLVVTTSDRRLKSLQGTTATQTDKIFWFTTFERITKQGFWSEIWQRSKDYSVRALIETP